MKTSIIFLFALSSTVMSTAVLADEVGGGKPNSSNMLASTSTDPATPTTECSILATWLGLCSVESEENPDS